MKKILFRFFIAVYSIVITGMACVLIALIHVIKFFRSGKFLRDPFHDSRTHPLNSPDALRG